MKVHGSQTAPNSAHAARGAKVHGGKQPGALAAQLPQLGFNEAWGRYDIQAAQLGQLASSAGASLGRINVCWNDIEKQPGVYDQDALERLDDTIGAMQAQGIKPVLVALGAPAWAHPSNPSSSTVPQDPQFDGAFGSFAGMISQRYPGAAAVEVWNEPNLPAYGNIPASRYAQMLTAATAGIHGANPGMQVLSAGLSPVQGGKHGKGGWESYLQTVVSQARGDFSVSLHPYVRNGDAKAMASKTEAQVQAAEKIAGKRGVWITEMGYSSGELSQKKQARALRDTFESLAGDKNLKAIILHRLMDDPGYVPDSSWEQGLGMLDSTGAPKRVYRMMERIFG